MREQGEKGKKGVNIDKGGSGGNDAKSGHVGAENRGDGPGESRATAIEISDSEVEGTTLHRKRSRVTLRQDTGDRKVREMSASLSDISLDDVEAGGKSDEVSSIARPDVELDPCG